MSVVLWQEANPLGFGPPPRPDRRIRAATRRMEQIRRDSSSHDWWRSRTAVQEIAAQLDLQGYAVINEFFLDSDAVRELVTSMLSQSSPGLINGGRASALRGDSSMFVAPGPDDGAMSILSHRVDSLVSMLREDATIASVQEGLKTVFRRSDPMVACYPRNGSYYVRHLDNVCANGHGARCNGRRLTTVYYLNRGATEHGLLRLFRRGLPSSDAIVDIAPIRHRLVIFWSDERVPHAVTPTADEDRCAVTFWFFDDAELNRTQGAGTPILRPIATDSSVQACT
jgi:hypothetical protein